MSTNPATPTGILGQTLNFKLDITVPAGDTFNPNAITVTSNGPGSGQGVLGTPVQSTTDPTQWTVTGTVGSPTTAGTYLVSCNVSGVDNQDVAVTWNPPPVVTEIFDPTAFTFT